MIACDRDLESLELAKENTVEFADRIRFQQATFAELGAVLAAKSITQLDGLLADLGVSRYQLTTGERGFSLMADGPLDMRLDRSQGPTAAEIVNYESEKDLADLIYKLGEERRSRQIARAIVRARPIMTTGHLAKVIEQAASRTGKNTPRYADLYGAADRGESGTRAVGRAARMDPAAGETGRTRGDHHVHVHGRPCGKTQLSGDGERRSRSHSDPSRRASCGTRD